MDPQIYYGFSRLVSSLSALAEEVAKVNAGTNWATVAALIQSSAFSIGILVGGIWAYKTYKELRSKSRAEADLEVLKKSLIEFGEITIGCFLEQFNTDNKKNRIISAVFSFKNTGNRYVTLKLSNESFSAAKIEFGDSLVPFCAAVQYSPTLANKMSPKSIYTELTIDPGGSASRPVVFKVKEPGLYQIEAFVLVSQRATEEHAQLGVSPPQKGAIRGWNNASFINIV